MGKVIDPKNIKKFEAKQIIRLLNQWTRAEIMARFGRFDNLEYADYFLHKIEKEDEIRKLIFGTSDLVELGQRWGLVKEKHKRRKKIARI